MRWEYMHAFSWIAKKMHMHIRHLPGSYLSLCVTYISWHTSRVFGCLLIVPAIFCFCFGILFFPLCARENVWKVTSQMHFWWRKLYSFSAHFCNSCWWFSINNKKGARFFFFSNVIENSPSREKMLIEWHDFFNQLIWITAKLSNIIYFGMVRTADLIGNIIYTNSKLEWRAFENMEYCCHNDIVDEK